MRMVAERLCKFLKCVPISRKLSRCVWRNSSGVEVWQLQHCSGCYAGLAGLRFLAMGGWPPRHRPVKDAPRCLFIGERAGRSSSDNGRRESESCPSAPDKRADAPGQCAGTNNEPTRPAAVPACRGQQTDRAECLVQDGRCGSLEPYLVLPTMPNRRTRRGRIRCTSQPQFRHSVI